MVQRRLYLKKDSRCNIPIHSVDGVCHVKQLSKSEDIESWVQHDDHFYLNQQQDDGDSPLVRLQTKLQRCKICDEKRVEKMESEKALKKRNKPLRVLELFSGMLISSNLFTMLTSLPLGAGGLGTGLDMSGYVETKYAVEYYPAAAITFR